MRKKWYKVPAMVGGVYAAMALLVVQSAALASSAERVTVVKQYELLEDADYVSFELEGYDGAFTSSMTLPDGKMVGSAKTTKKMNGSVPCWVNVFSVKPARKGKYTFTIQAPKQAYYNLSVNVPLFSDIPNHWAEDEINAFVRKGIVSGYGNGRFGPNEAVTGEAIVKMAVLALTEEMPSGKRGWLKTFRLRVADQELSREMGFQEYSFAAAAGDRWSEPYMAAAADLGITANWSEKELTAAFKREDIALLLANIVSMVETKSKTAGFTDTKGLPLEYQQAIDLVSNYSIFSGYPDNTFKPEKEVTRAEAVIVLSKLAAFLGE